MQQLLWDTRWDVGWFECPAKKFLVKMGLAKNYPAKNCPYKSFEGKKLRRLSADQVSNSRLQKIDAQSFSIWFLVTCISRILKTICQCNGDSSGVVNIWWWKWNNIWWWKWNYLFSEMTKAIDGFVEDSATVIMVVYSIQETLFVDYENKTDEGIRFMIMWMMMRGTSRWDSRWRWAASSRPFHNNFTVQACSTVLHSTLHIHASQNTLTCSTVHICSTVHTCSTVLTTTTYFWC